MGRPIVYCGICGKSLKDEDFSRGRAHLVDNAPFCTTCRIVPEPLPQPVRPAPPPPAPKPAASSKSLVSGTPRYHTPSPPQPESSSTGLVIGIAVVVFALIVLVVILMNSGGPSAPPPDHPHVPYRGSDGGRPPVPRTTDGEDPALKAIRNLEAFASSSADSDALLDKCQEAKPILQGTPHLARLEAIEARAIEARNLRSRERQLAMSLEGAQKLRDLDGRFERRQEIESMYRAASVIAGSRKLEVDRMLLEYQKAADAFAAKPPDPPSPPKPGPAPAPIPASTRLGPYEVDDGGMVHHWLVLGPFGNRKDRTGFQDHDLLRTEQDHVPVAGQEVLTREGTKVLWTPAVSLVDRVAFRAMECLGLGSKPADPAVVFAACWLSVEKDCEVKFRMLVDDGYLLWLDHKRILKYSGKNFGSPEEGLQVSLTAGAHLVLLKVGTVGSADFGFRLRILGLGGERVPGLRVWNQVPVAPKLLFSENFNQGRGAFVDGTPVPGGVDGTQALAIPKKGAYVETKLPEAIGPTWTIRFKAKALHDMNAMQLLVWSNRSGKNYWYHIRLKKDQWTPFEVKASQLNNNWEGRGPTLEGELANNVRFYFDDAVPDGSVLIDDIEITE